jgi:hypothetical protein
MALVGPLLEICNPLFEVGTAVSVVGSLDGTKGPDRHRSGDGDMAQGVRHSISSSPRSRGDKCGQRTVHIPKNGTTMLEREPEVSRSWPRNYGLEN